MVIYKYVENHQMKEDICASTAEAVKRAIKDMASSHIYPREIATIIMDRDAIERAWEAQCAY
jgi:hypothetical protein